MKKQRILSVLLAVLLILPLIPAGPFTAFASDLDVAADTTELTDGNTYHVRSNVTNANRINVSGTAVLVLDAGATLTLTSGVNVTNGNTLTIRGSGTLIAQGNNECAAIGCPGTNAVCGVINIEGGNITATGGANGAGIGGGLHSQRGGSINISGGTVTAVGGTNGAGIGGGGNPNWGGDYGCFGYVTITGGTVVATGNAGGAGIGGGGCSIGGNGKAGIIQGVSLTGGHITATGGENGYGIGPGVNTVLPANSGTECPVTIGLVDSLNVNSFKGTFAVAEGAILTDGENEYTGTLTAEQLAALSGAQITSLVQRTTMTVDGVEYYVYEDFTATDGAAGTKDAENWDKLVDGDVSTKYCRTSSGAYAVFHAEEGFMPHGYILTTADDTASNPGRNPKSWTLKGKVNEQDGWTTLATVNGDTTLGATNFTDYCFSIDYSGDNADKIALYKYFRIDFTAYTSGSTFQLAELRFYGRDYGVRPVYACISTCTQAGYALNCYLRTDGLYFADEDCTQELDASNVILPLAPHTPVFHAAVPHTGDSNGTIAYYECGVCHKFFAEEECTTELTASQLIDYSEIPYLDGNGGAAVLDGEYTLVENDTHPSFEGGWYVVIGNVTISSRIIVSGTVNLILCNGATLTAGKGVTVPEGAALNIYAQSTGSNAGVLTASASDAYFAGIGGDAEHVHSGVVTICGGVITATGGTSAAGIGGGYNGKTGFAAAGGTGTVVIRGGSVTATGGGTSINGGAGIGGGWEASGTVTITGGTVTATGGKYAAGIGGGAGAGGSTVSISGGTVTATAQESPAIGTGGGTWPLEGATIDISGGVISANGASPALGSNGYAGSISITGGQITVNNALGGSCDYSGHASGVTIALGNSSDFISCAGVSANSITVNGSATIERNGTKYKADENTVRNSGVIRPYTGDFHTVRFLHGDGTTVIDTAIIASGYTVPRPSSNPVLSRHVFICWNCAGEEYDFSTPVTTDLDIVAVFEEVPEISYLNENGASVAINDYGLILPQSGDLTLPAGTYAVNRDVTISGRLILQGDTVLILQNGTTLNVTNAILISSLDCTLTIYGQAVGEGETAGKLIARSSENGYAAIGYKGVAKTGAGIFIYGGRIEAYGKSTAAGIGGGESTCANVLIGGGSVYATCQNQAAAIGSGCNARGFGYTVTITGGSVTAVGGSSVDDGVGIGGGCYNSSAKVLITGGVVNATGYHNGAGIGSAAGSFVSITITGGIVNAVSYPGQYGAAAAIGSGYYLNNPISEQGAISITGGRVTVLDNGGTNYGIGGLSRNSAITITLGTTVNTDQIYSPAYNGTVSFANQLKLKGTSTIATTSNIAGKTLIGSNVSQITVTFVDENGTTVIGTRTIFPGDAVNAPDAPDKTTQRKRFVGWTLNGVLFDLENEMISVNTTLKAYYEALPAPSGAGTASDPFIIASVEDWNKFADLLSVYGLTLAGTYTELAANVTVSRMIGTSSVRYAGTFDGKGHILTLDINSTAQMAAPFSYVEGATIRHLITNGTVTSTTRHASGLVGSANGVTIYDCRVSATIQFDPTHVAYVYSGGLIGHAQSSPFTIEGCVFDGRIAFTTSTFNSLTQVAGLVGWDDASTPNIINSVFMGSVGKNANEISRIARVGGRGTITNCFSTTSSTCSGDHNDDRGTYVHVVSISDNAAFGVTSSKDYAVTGIKVLDEGIYVNGKILAVHESTITINVVCPSGEPPVDARFVCTANNGTLTYVSDNSYSLVTHPYRDIVITAVKEYFVKTADLSPNLGTIAVSPAKAAPGTTVTVTVIGNNAILDSVSVNGATYSGCTKVNDLTWTFTMPAESVTVSAAFTPHTIAGTGTQTDPYLIGSVDDWTVFAQKVNGGQTSACGKMIANVSGASYMAGTADNRYGGVFDGNGHTLDFSFTTYEQNCAPFHFTNGAKIVFLRVTGTIVTNYKYTGGIVGGVIDTTLVGCRSSVEIVSVIGDVCSIGGVAGHVLNGKLTLRNCLFDGKLTGADSTAWGGLVGWCENNYGDVFGSVDLFNNYFAPAALDVSTQYGFTLARCPNTNGIGKASNNYCTSFLDKTQNAILKGDRTEAEISALLGNGWILENGRAVPATDRYDLTHAELKVAEPRIRYTGSEIAFDVSVILPDGTLVTEGLNVSYDAAPVAIGAYTLSVTLDGYTGVLTGTVEVTEYDGHLLNDGNGWYMLMPLEGTLDVYLDNLPEGFSFLLYDDGGPATEYCEGYHEDGCDATVYFHGPDGLKFTVTGSGHVEGGNYDHLNFYDSDLATDLYGMNIGRTFTLEKKTTSGNALAVKFYSDANLNYSGFDLKITVSTGREPCDVNDDGAVTIADVTALLDHLSTATAYDGYFDLDENGGVTISDVSYLLDYLATMN